MLSQINTCGLMGIDGFMVEVQTDVTNGMPHMEIIGLPDATVKESKERARASIKNSGFVFPSKRMTINLAPASQRKEGSSYDLPITVSILAASEQIQIEDNENSVFIGELSLDGSVGAVSGVLPMVISAYKNGFTRFFVPRQNADEAAVIDGVEIYPVSTLLEVIDHFSGGPRIAPYMVDLDAFLQTSAACLPDMSEVKGQENVKRALEVSASGGHNVLLVGEPGAGKSMLARRMAGILPDLTFDEALEVTKIHSIAGTLPAGVPLITTRPFRSPHHTVSSSALSGGGPMPKPGELSLAHHGILFLDELPEFKRDALEVLRQPLEDGEVTISRVNATLTYPCNIMLIASMNPCKCGYFGSQTRECSCTPVQVAQYRSKISGPLLDRIDIQVEVASVGYDDLSARTRGEASAEIKHRVDRARKVQLERYAGQKIYSNSQLTPGMLHKFCPLGEAENKLMRNAFERLGLSARAHSKILKVARTIADLDGSDGIKTVHLAEAIQYRSLDRKYFGA